MKVGLAALALSYILSQFFRSYLAVLAPVLEADIGAMPDDLSRASSLFFLTFAAAQIGVGWSLDRFGPRLTAALPFGLFIAVGFFGSMYPIVIAHGMSLVPKDLTGRGTSLLNLFNIGGVALLQWLSAFSFTSGSHTYPPVFLTTAGFLALGLVVYVAAAKPTGA